MIHEVMSSSGLSVFAEVGLVLFMITFIGQTIRVLRRSKAEDAREASLPLDDGGELEPVRISGRDTPASREV